MFSQELFQNSGFYIRISKKFQDFPGFLFKIPGFFQKVLNSRFPGKMANLEHLRIFNLYNHFHISINNIFIIQ